MTLFQLLVANDDADRFAEDLCRRVEIGEARSQGGGGEAFWEGFAETLISIASSDSGVVSSTSGGSRRIGCRCGPRSAAIRAEFRRGQPFGILRG